MKRFQKPYSDDIVICTLCNHYCKIKDGKTGLCGVNGNIGGEMGCLVYGYPSALAVDPIEKKPLYHFLPNTKSFSIGTVGCNFKCPFCQNWRISQTSQVDKSQYFSPNDIVDLALKSGSESISYTYNEPTIFYPYAREIALKAKGCGLKNIFVTNGFESQEVLDDMVGIIDAVNVDLKSFNEGYYKQELLGDLHKVQENLKFFVEHGIWLEVTTLIVPTKNDSNEELKMIAEFIANELGVFVPWHISAFHPDYKENKISPTSFELLKSGFDIGKEAGLKFIYMGNMGVENATLCPQCGDVLIERKHFGVSKNRLVDGLCPSCNYKLQGVFQ